MSDFFMSKQDDYWKNKTQEYQTRAEKQQIDQETQTTSKLSQKAQEYNEQKQAHYENWNRYGVEVPDEYYNVFNNIISKAETPEIAQEEAYRIGSAIKYSQMMGIPLEEAYKNVDALNEANFTDLQNQKGRYEALCDMFNLGRNNVELGKLGQELLSAQWTNDTERVEKLMPVIDSINSQNKLMQDNTPRSWVMEALECGAQSAPFTGYVAGAGIIGNLIAPVVGTGASFYVAANLTMGQEYIDLITNGASPETARTVALLSGSLQGIIEADLGITKGIVKGGAKLVGKTAAKEITEEAAKRSLSDIARKVYKRFHFGASKKLIINYLEEYGKNVLGEGTEEFLQELTSIAGQEIAASLDGYDIPDDDFKSIVKQTTEAFRGGVLGALSMGFIPAGINGAADVKNYKLIKDTAEAYESSEMFKNAVKDNPVFENMSDEEKTDVIQEIWKNAQQRKENYANAEAKNIAEVQDAAEGAEERRTNEEGEELEAEPVVREESGSLMYSDDENVNDDGTVKGTLRAGDKTKAEGNRYGYINYAADEKNKTVVIDDFKMAKGREGLRSELYDEFARKYAGYNIEWNTIGSEATGYKENLIENNPSGSKKGLNYYADQNAVADASTRSKVAAEVKKNIHNVSVSYDENGNQTVKRTELSNKQVASAVALLEAAAKRTGMNLSDYVNKTFGNQIFGSTEDFTKAAAAQGDKISGKAGGVNQGVAQEGWQQFGQQVKAVIYAGENADFSTWTHELAHIFQNQLEGDLKAQAERAFNVVNGDWIGSKYTFKDGHIDSAAEAFAYGFQDWLKTGKAESEELKNIFQKFAEFIARAYNSLKDFINLTPEIESVYNQLLSGDDSLMRKAEKAVEDEDRRYRSQMQQKVQESQEAKRAEAEKQKAEEFAEKEEASETTEFEEESFTPEKAAEQLAEAENKLSEGKNETEQTNNAIDDALKNTNLTDEKKVEISETLKDDSSTIVEKAEAVTEAAESVYDEENEIPDDLFFQLAGEPSIQRMAESEEKERILADLDAAKLLDGRYKSMDAKSKAARIRMMTGWEKDASGQWKYELDDSINRIKGGSKLAEILRSSPDSITQASDNALLNLGDILDAPELFKVFPYMENVRVSFYSDPNAFRAVLTPEGIKVNVRYLQGVDGEKGLKGVLAHEIQHVIQAMEYAESKGIQGEDIEQLYNDMMGAMQAAGERKYDYDITSLQNGLDAYMKDAGEIEARNVARRILMNADERRHTTLASTEDVQRNVLFQDIAEKLNNAKKIDVTTADELPDFVINFDKKNKEMLNKAINWGLEQIGTDAVGHDEIGEVKFFKKGVRDSIFHGFKNPLKARLFKKLSEIIPNSVVINKEEENGKIKSYVLAGKINVDGTDYYVTTVVKVDQDGNKYYNHSTIKKSELGQRQTRKNAATQSRPDTLSILQDILNVKQNNADYQEAAKKAQDLLFKNKISRILFQDEINTIRKQYENTDQWMKTPNGAETKLNEKQWLQVRTPSFKKWFGDWEKDPQNASKVVDENGEPLVVYHGTKTKDVTVFDKKKIGSQTDEGIAGRGFYFTPDKMYSLHYTDNNDRNIIAAFLNIRNPYHLNNSTMDDFNAMYLKYTEGEYEEEYFNNLEKNPKTAFGDALDKGNEELKKAGYDGVIFEYDLRGEYIAFESNQIKSATDNSGAFDPENPSILFQDEYDPRSLVPNVRGGWTEKKIIKYLKDNPTLSGVVNAIRFIKEFDTPEELKAHMFYHGTALGSDKLKPSITMSDRDIERYGGGGYGQKYWSISVSKSKKVASNFAPMSDGVRIYPIILAKNAKVIEMPELTDSVELEDHIIDLWNKGVDAVWIGDKDSGEQELSILNPRAVVNIGRADWYKNYALGTEKNPINIKDDEQIKEMFDYAKNYERKTEFDFGKPEKPLKKPSRYNFDDTRPSGDKLVPNLNYDTEIAEYNKAMEDYEQAVNDWYSSDDYKEWEKFDRERRNVIFFQVIGEIGAQNLDDTEVQEGVSRMQNLAIAKQMDVDGKDAQAIRLATGWEKGGDGKWKYEIDDSKIKTDFEDKSYLFRIRNPRYGELEEKLKSLNYDWEKLSKEEQEEFDKLGDLYNENLERNEVVLMEILDAPELFRAYPQLREMPVTFKTRDYSQNYEAHLVNGYYVDDNSPYFAIEFNGTPNSYNSESFKSTLLHEIQHAIQRIEGFGRGGNLEEAAELIEKDNQNKAEIKSKAFAWEWKIELEKQEEKYPELKGNLALMNSLIDEYTENGKYPIKELEDEHWLPERDIRDKGFNLYVRGYDKEGFEEAYKEWQKKAGKKGVTVFNPTKDTERNRFNYYKRFAGEIESRNVQTRMNFTPEQRLNTLLAATEDVAPEDRIILFQEVYHGSGADFDKFDTENFGLSGEGSMSFGYGTYLTDSEEIARDYADRAKEKILDLKWYPMNHIKNEMDKGVSFEDAKKKEIEDIKRYEAETINPIKKDNYQYQIRMLEKMSQEELFSDKVRHLYTVEIPDNGYIVWDKPVRKQTADKIKRALFNEITTNPDSAYYNYYSKSDLMQELDSVFSYMEGQQLYRNVSAYLEGDEKASKFLRKIGYAGIKYPAGTIHGNGRDAYNYVIFNDDDAKIVDKLLFQTNAELMDEAKDFDSWQEFMEFCETMHADDEVSPIPGDADAQWYQTFWETSNGLKTEQEKIKEEIAARPEEDSVPLALDALFSTYIRSYPEMLDNFLREVAEIDAIDLDSEEMQQAANEEEAQEREQIDKLKDYIGITLSDYNWQTAMKRVRGGHEISEGLRKRLIGEITDNFKVRDFRALYAEVMGDEQYAVAEEDSITAALNKKLKKYHDIVAPGDDISRWSPEKRKQLAEQLQNRELAAKIRNGTLKLDDEVDAYFKSLEKQIKDLQKNYNELEKETQNDYQRIADAERRRLLKLHDELLIAKSKLNTRNAEIERKIKKGLKITEKYKTGLQNYSANYDEIFRKFYDLKDTIQITAEVQAALDRQEKLAGIREDLNSKQKEKNLTAEIKKMRIQLVKRTMRRVPFNRIDYNNAKTVIAIQRMLEPNLLGGVNRFIGIDSPYLRGVISQIITDNDYKEKILHYLSKNTKSSQAFVNFKKKLEELKTIKDFDTWTAKERKAAIRYLPKENWVKDLDLMKLAQEREESIDLDIDTEEYIKPVYDPKTGDMKTYRNAEGNDITVTETAFRLKYSDELKNLVMDAVGANMFDLIINKPFAEWTTEELESLAKRIDEIYTEGRDLKAAKDEARKRDAAAIRKRIEDAIKETGITINDDDTPEEKERKQKLIDKKLGMSSDLKGTEAGKTKGFKAKLNRLLHSYSDMNVLRFARMLDGQSEGENVRMLYRMEDDCYINKTRSMVRRGETVNKIMADNKITEGSLAESIAVPELNTSFTVDELLFFLAADKDYVEDERGNNDDWAATSRNAVMFGNMMSDNISQDKKEEWMQLDKDMQDLIENDALTAEQKQLLAIGELDTKPGTSAYRLECHTRWNTVLGVANSFIESHPEYKALMEAIEADYAEQYERMNEISITEFNQPVHRVRAYVPLVRRESNGDTNENQVKEDLLGVAGVGKQWADRGMTKRRVNMSPLNQKPVQTGLFRTWGDSIERTEHFIAYAPYVRQLNAVYKSRDASYTRRFIESRYGANAVKYIDEYINEVANPNAGRIRERGAEWLHVLRGKTAPAYLGWKASAIIKQGLTSPWPYMQFVNPAEYFSAAMKFTFNPQMREAIKEKSVFMKMRRMDPVNDLIDEMADNAKGKVERAWSNFSKLGMQGLELIDWACVAPGWLACYEKKYNQLQKASDARYNEKVEELKERNMYADVTSSEYLNPQQIEAQARKEMLEDIEVEAVRYADDCTRQCQPSNRVTDLAPLFKNSSEAMKAFLQFQTSLNVIWQNIRYDMPYAVKNKEFNRIAGTVIGYVCAGIFMNSVMEGIGGDDDDDETQALRNLLYYSTTQFTDAIPIMGSEITNTMDQLITGKRGFASSGTDMTPSATKLLSVLTTAKKGNWEKAASLTAEGIGLFLGAPVSGVKEINKLLGKPLSEGDVNLKRGVSNVYGIAGDILEE